MSDEALSDKGLPERTGPIVRFSGAVELETIEEACAQVKTVFETGGGLVFDLSEVTALDLTLVQLIESARQTAVAAGKPARLTAPAAGAVRTALERGGFLSEPADARTRFWLCQQG